MPSYHVIEQWHTVASDYPRASKDGWAIQSRTQGPGIYPMQTEGSFYYHRDPIALTELTEDGKLWFNDEPRQIYALAEIGLFRARGRVIVGGLGLGLIHHFLALNPNVTSVLTIERARELETLVWPEVRHLGGVLVVGDFYERAPDYEADTVITDFLFNLEREETWQQLQEQRAFCRKHFPDALFLEHGYQRRMDAETVAREVRPSPWGTQFASVKIFR